MADEKLPDEAQVPESEAAVASGGQGDEFAGIRSRRRRRSPVIAVAVLLVGGVLLYHLRADLRYALSSSTPQPLGDAVKLLREGCSLPDDRLVEILGQPDYRNALLFEPRGDTYQRALFRLIGTGTRLLVRGEQTSTRHVLEERFVGRLQPFDVLPYADQIRDYYAKKVHVTRFLDLRQLRVATSASAGGPGVLTAVQGRGKLKDVNGEEIVLDAEQPLTVIIEHPDHLKVALSKDKFAVEEDARHEVARLGAPVIGTAQTTKDRFVYVVGVPVEGRNAFISKLDEAGIEFAAHRERLSARPGEVSLGAEDITIGSARHPWARVASIQVEAPVVIPADAWVVVEGELPGSHLWAPVVASLLALFMLFNLFLLVRNLRARRDTQVDG